jgi:hypothetical protein
LTYRLSLVSFIDMYTPGRVVSIAHAIVTLFLVFALFIAVIYVISAGVGIARDGRSLTYGDEIDVPVELENDLSYRARDLPPNVRFRGEPKVFLEIKDPTTREMLLRSISDVLALTAFALGAWFLRSFLGLVLDGEPFGRSGARRLRALGALLVVGAPVVLFVVSVLENALVDGAPGVSARGFSLPGTALVAGLGAYVLAEVIAHGAELREDVEGTV